MRCYSYEAAGGSEAAVMSELGQELNKQFVDYFKSHTAKEAIQMIIDLKLGAAVINNCEDVMSDPHWQKRGDWVRYEDQTLEKEVTAFGFVPKLSDTPGQVWRGAPRLGQDTEAVLEKLLDYTPEEIGALKGNGIID